MLSDDNIASRSQARIPQNIPPITRSVASPQPPPEKRMPESWQQEWWHHYGWNRPNDIPAPPSRPPTRPSARSRSTTPTTSSAGGGREPTASARPPGPASTTAPRSSDRYDYFQLPDWDCYSLSGKSVTFYMPDEPWNHLEIEGGAWGNRLSPDPGKGNPNAVADPDQHDTSPQLATTLFERPEGAGAHQPRSHPDPSPARKSASPTSSRSGPSASSPPTTSIPAAEPAGIAELHLHRLPRTGALDNPSLADTPRPSSTAASPPTSASTMVADACSVA